MPDNDLNIQLEGLFADALPEPEITEAEEAELLLDRTIVDFLRGEEEEEEKDRAEPAAAGPELVKTLPPVLVQPEKAERAIPAPRPAEFLAWKVELQNQRTRILNVMLNCLAVIGTVIVIFLLVNLFQEPSRWFSVYVPYFAAYAVLMILALVRRINLTVRATGLIVLAYGIGIAALLAEGPLSAGGLYLLAAPLLFSILVRQQAGTIAAVVSSLIYTSFLLADHLGWLHPSIPYRSEVLSSVLSLIATSVLINACIMLVQRMFNHTLTSALREAEQKHDESARSRSLLEERADELGKANALLQKHTLQLQTAAQVSAAAAFSVIDPDELMQQVVNLIHDRFDLHYVGLFLTTPPHPSPDAGEETEEWARLQVGTGEVGRQLLAQGHKIKVDDSSPVGWCIVNAQASIALDAQVTHLTSSVPIEQANANTLPLDTRSEMALPLRSRGRVIGALTLQSTDRDSFSQEDIPVLQTMADQIAVSIDNAQLFAETQTHLEEMEKVQRRYVREQWTEFTSTQAAPIYERTQPDVTPLGNVVPPEVEQAMMQQETVAQSGTGNEIEPAALVVPINLRGEAIGALGLQEMESGRQWTDNEVALIEDVTNQMALAIENARLLEETRRRAERERIIANITARVRSSMDPEIILQTAVRELGAALGTDRTFVRLGGGKQTNEK
ncbi:MAG: GAF domain-containing protein [Chloroflexota bacterium]|nr:GAF domain-containing protein [Chloroflexota bacterium]